MGEYDDMTGAERELALMAKVTALEKERDRLREALEAIDKVWGGDEDISDIIHEITRAALEGGK